MNRKHIALIIIFSVAVFGGLVYYGWTHRYGASEGTQPKPFPEVRVPYLPQGLELSKEDLSAGVWEEVPALDVSLMHQITEKPWPRGLTPSVELRAFHDGKNIYLRLHWQDDKADRAMGIGKFVDACAVAIPLDAEAPAESIMMGFTSAVNIWDWKADRDAAYWEKKQPGGEDLPADYYYPFENQEVAPIASPEITSAVEDLLTMRAGSLTIKEKQNVQGRGEWNDGRWSVIFKRSLTTDDPESAVQVAPGKRSVALAVWDGDQGDRGARKSISDWILLEIESAEAAKGVGALEKGMQRDSMRAGFDAAGPFRWVSHVLAVTTSSGESQEVGKEPRLIEIIAKRFEFNPAKITLQKGELVTIQLESIDVTHGFYLDGYGIQLKARPGLIGKATFVADKTGRFSYRCSETCGEFHPYMIGYLTVEPNSRFHVFLAAMGGAVVLITVVLVVAQRRTKGGVSNV